MVFFNYATMQMAAKIVYYGPGLCGKTTNLQFIYQKTSPKSRGEMVSLETETDRTLFFDLLPLDVGNIAGFKTRFQLYTVPGQVFYNSTRKLVLRGVDGIVFVGDSQIPMMDANVESYSNLKANLAELGYNLDEIPLVFQYNKRDLKNVATVAEMNGFLNPKGLPYFEASALRGDGVFETLKGISKATLITLRKRALGEDRVKAPEAPAKPVPEKPKIATPPPPAPEPVAVPASSGNGPSAAEISVQATGPVGAVVPESPGPGPEQAPVLLPPVAPPKPVLVTPAEIAKENIEFSELSTPAPKPSVKKISVSTSDIAGKLDALRDIYTGKSYSKDKKDRSEGPDPLAALLESAKEKEKRVTKTLKIRLDPEEIDLVKDLSVDFQLSGGSIHKKFSNAMNVSVEGKGNPKRVTLEIKIEILKK